jgi:hypothetical protein
MYTYYYCLAIAAQFEALAARADLARAGLANLVRRRRRSAAAAPSVSIKY